MIPSSFSRLNVPRLAGAILLAAAAFMPLSRAAEPLRVVTLHTVLTEIAREVGGDAVTGSAWKPTWPDSGATSRQTA